MTVIDVHGHIGSWHDFFIPQTSAQWLVETNERLGIDAAGISHLVAVGHDACVGNRMALEEARHFPERLGVWLVANPHARDGAAELREQVTLEQVWGLKIHPDVHEYSIIEAGYEAYFELAEEHGLPVLSHGQTDSRFSDPALLAEVCARYPSLDLLMGHSGLWPHGFDRAISLATDHPGLHLEICGSRLTTWWLERMVERAGAEKVLFGTDAVFLDPRVGLGKVIGARLSEHDRALVMGGNAQRILTRARSRR